MNASHIAPMTSHCTTSTFNQGSGEGAQFQPNCSGNGSVIPPNHGQHSQRMTDAGRMSRRQYNAQSQSEKEEELAEWLNDAYKRKR